MQHTWLYRIDRKPRKPRLHTAGASRLHISIGETPTTLREQILRERSAYQTIHQTEAERLTGTILHALTIPARRQVVIGRYIVDYLLLQQSAILEIDGPIHAGQAEYDARRDRWLSSYGWRVIRIPSDQVSHERIRSALQDVPSIAVRTTLHRLALARQAEALRTAQSVIHRPATGSPTPPLRP